MPELPEVETSRRGIQPYCEKQRITKCIIREKRLRWLIPNHLSKTLLNLSVDSIQRRGKYLLFNFNSGTMLMHLGMSGSIRIINTKEKPQKHDHLDILFDNEYGIRFNDPRRFGAVLWTNEDPYQHPLLAHLGPEPLSRAFNGTYLYELSRSRKTAIKSLIMNAATVVGVGNIYASEALFQAGIHPLRAANRISQERYQTLTVAIKDTLRQAIKLGGSTLKDYVNADGKPGYFAQTLAVYGREGQPCQSCDATIKSIRLNQRSTCYCPRCQR